MAKPVLATLVVLLLLAPAARADVSNPVLTNAPPSNGAGARTQYVVTFQTSAAGGLSQAANSRITFAFPAGVDLSTFTGGVVNDVSNANREVGSCSRSAQTITCGLYSGESTAGGDSLKATLNAITNPAAGSVTVDVSTTAEPAPVTSSQATVAAAQPVTGVTLSIAPPSNGAGARTQYVLQFTTSSTGGLSQAANSRVTFAFPAGVDLSTFTGGVVNDVSNANREVGSCSRSAQTITCGLYSGESTLGGHLLKATLNAITNPAAGTVSVNVSTTSDPAAVPSPQATVAAAQPVTGVTLSVAPPSNAAGARTQYVLQFTTSSTGGLSQAANSRVTFAFPAGVDLSTFTGGVVNDVSNANREVGSCSRSAQTIICGLYSGESTLGGHLLKATLNAITNPAAGTVTVNVSTTSDPAAVPSPQATVAAAQPVTGVTLSVAPPSNAAGARTQYVLQFTTSSTGGLSQAANSRVTFAFPAGVDLSTFTGGVVNDVSNANREVGSCSRSAQTIICGLYSGESTLGGHVLKATLNAITNPAAGTVSVNVSTTSDPAAVPSPQATVAAAGALTGVTVTPATTAQSALTQYAIGFTTSTTGGLSQPANSRVTFTFPAAVNVATFTGGVVNDVSNANREVGSCSRSAQTIICGLYSGESTLGGHVLKATLNNITNPATPGSYTITVATTSDTVSANGSLSTAQDTTPPDTSVAGGNASGFTFSSTEAGGTFECSLDGGPFTACTSPYVPPPLPDGDHTFAVRAVDGAGNRDLTPAVSTFRVTSTPSRTPSPSPAPQPTPTPTPTPVPGQTVVAAPVSGKVLVKKPGAKGFVEVDANEGIPLGSTVDTTHGVVEITAKPGQVAQFHDGIFKVTQTKTTTDLTLTQPLAPCGKGAKAAAKKPKTRRLWGSGSGSFRTRGQYSSATVRGTTWLVQDSCSGTLTRVTKGVVSVQDNVKHKTILLKAGKSYLARPKR